MEEKYPHAGHNDGERKRVFFRNNRSTEDMVKQCAVTDFKRFVENKEVQMKMFGYDLDENSGCSESCEMLEMEDIDD